MQLFRRQVSSGSHSVAYAPPPDMEAELLTTVQLFSVPAETPPPLLAELCVSRQLFRALAYAPPPSSAVLPVRVQWLSALPSGINGSENAPPPKLPDELPVSVQ